MAPLVAVMIAAAVVKTIGTVQQANAQQAQLKSEASAHDYNATIADQNRQAALEQGSSQEESVRRNARGILGSQAAVQAQSGVDPGSGSALLVAKQSADNAELDSLRTLYGADMRARGYQQAAETERFHAANARANVAVVRRSMWTSIVGNGVGAASSIYGSGSMMGSTAPTTAGGGYGTGGGNYGSSSGFGG